MIDLTNPDVPTLMQKWGTLFKTVEPLNKFDTPLELMWLAEAASQATNILECGAHRGISTKLMALANPKAKIVVLDAWHDVGCFEFFSSLLSAEIASGQITTFQGTTDEGFVKLKSSLPDFQPDFTFIDASHLYPDVLHDIQNALSLMKTGLISGHDYRHSLPDDGVTKSVREAFSSAFSLPADSIWAKTLSVSDPSDPLHNVEG